MVNLAAHKPRENGRSTRPLIILRGHVGAAPESPVSLPQSSHDWTLVLPPAHRGQAAGTSDGATWNNESKQTVLMLKKGKIDIKLGSLNGLCEAQLP